MELCRKLHRGPRPPTLHWLQCKQLLDMLPTPILAGDANYINSNTSIIANAC